MAAVPWDLISRSSGHAWPRGPQSPSSLPSDGLSWQVRCCLSALIHQPLPEGKSSPSRSSTKEHHFCRPQLSSQEKEGEVFNSSPSRPVITGASDFLRFLQGEHKGH